MATPYDLVLCILHDSAQPQKITNLISHHPELPLAAEAKAQRADAMFVVEPCAVRLEPAGASAVDVRSCCDVLDTSTKARGWGTEPGRKRLAAGGVKEPSLRVPEALKEKKEKEEKAEEDVSGLHRET